MADQVHVLQPIRPDWLALRQEAALDPGLPIVDAHHHLIDREQMLYMLPALQRDLASGHALRATVFVESMSGYRTDGPVALRPVGETAFAVSHAASVSIGADRVCNVCAGIVGHADMLLGAAVEEVLVAHIAAGNGRFRGVRHATQWERHAAVAGARRPPLGLLGDASFRAGVGRLAALRLSFDAWLYFPQIPELTALARAFPDTSFILDHVGGPLAVGPYAATKTEMFRLWQAALAELATCPNVAVKIGGLAMPTLGFAFAQAALPPSSIDLAAAWRPYFEVCRDLFGPDRCMLESNFPVDKAACGYGVLWNAFKRLAADLTAAERAALFAGTAARVYRLPG